MRKMSKIVKVLYEEIFNRQADEQLELLDLDTEDLEKLAVALDSLRQETLDILQARLETDNDN
jgi:hypothetical protein